MKSWSRAKRKVYRWTLVFFIITFVGINGVGFMHAYRFTHFTDNKVHRTGDPKSLTFIEKAGILLTGISNPRPSNKALPPTDFVTVTIASDVNLEAWLIEVPEKSGTVILFHGYAGEKSSLLERAAYFRELGYSTLLVDFRGSGGSGGNSTSIGYHEAHEVYSCFEYVKASGEENIILFGTSMGSAAVLRAVDNYQLKASALLLECPFGSLYTTTCARFRNMGIPAFPMAGVLLFWGGIQNNFWPFSHNPAAYAKGITAPTLVLYGSHDDRVSLEEVLAINKSLKGEKRLVTYPDKGHNDLFSEEWKADVAAFLR